MAMPKRLAVLAVLMLCLAWSVRMEARRTAASANVARAETIRIPSEAGIVLAAELHVPQAGKRRHPAVLLLGGGGPSPHGIYPILEARLNARGIATLSFDKRGVGGSSGAIDDAMAPAQRDAAAALAYLRSRTDVIDPQRIAILGLSQGGVIGPALAVSNPPIAAVVVVAGPAGKRGELFLDAMRRQLATSGMTSAALEGVIAAARRYLDARTAPGTPDLIERERLALVQAFVRAGWPEDRAEGAVAVLGGSTLASMYTVAAGEVLAKVKAPVLAIYGADDTNVPSKLTMPEARLALRDNRDALVIEMPNVDHGFKPLVAIVSGKREYRGWPISDPATMDLIDRWLARRLKAPAK